MLTAIRQVRELTPEQAQLGYPVRVSGVVTWLKPETREFFVQDATAGIYIRRGDLDAGVFRPGQAVQIEGTTGPGFFARVVIAERLQPLGKGDLPRPRRLQFEQLAGGFQDGQWAELSGIVRSLERAKLYGAERLCLNIDMGDGTIRASFTEPPKSDPVNLVDARVRVRGVCTSFFNKRGQFLGPRINLTSMSDVQVDDPAPFATWMVREQPISEILRFHPRQLPGHRVKIRGSLTYQSKDGFFLQNGTQGIWVQTTWADRPKSGTVVEAVGFPTPGEYSPVLGDALFRPIAEGAPPSPLNVTAAQVLEGSYDSLLVTMSATVLEQVRRAGEWVFVLQQGESVFNAHLGTNSGVDDSDSTHRGPLPKAPILSDRFVRGTIVRLTGVCAVEVDKTRNPQSFRLLLRSPDDIAVVKRPAWLNQNRALWGLSLTGIASIAVLFWATSLRRRVRKQTDLIRQKLKREAALQQRYHDLFENASDMVYSRDMQGHFLVINRAGEQITGYRREEILRMTIEDLVQPEQREQVRQVNGQLLAREATTSFEFDIRTKAGRRLTLEVSARAIYEDGEAVRVDGIARDVTLRKLAQLELERAKDAADRASAAKSEFLANMSHEVRTPMNGIMGMTSLLLDSPLDAEQRGWLEAVQTSSESLLNLLNDILDFSKIEANKLVVESARLDLKSTLEFVIKLMGPAAARKGLHVRLDYAPEVPRHIVGDQARIRQIVLNYVVNAVKFTSEGEICVRVTPSDVLETTSGLRISVIDSGIGIPRERQADLFQKFSQADGSTTRRYGGTGLGLAISKQLAHLMGGAVGVVSESGLGSTFWVELPLKMSAAAEPDLSGQHGLEAELIHG